MKFSAVIPGGFGWARCNKQTKDFDSDDLAQSIRIYISSFPSNETRSPEKVVNMLNDKNYQLYVACHNYSVIGISLLYVFQYLDIGYLDYIAVKSDYQGKGVGKVLFGFNLHELERLISEAKGLLLEVQRDVANLQDNALRKNRVQFYMQLGAKILDGVDYILPPLQSESVPENMYLVMRPLKNIDFLSKESILQYISSIYSIIYQYQSDDILEKISMKTPARVTLCGMMI